MMSAQLSDYVEDEEWDSIIHNGITPQWWQSTFNASKLLVQLF